MAVAPRAALRVRSSIHAEHCEFPSFLVVDRVEPIQRKLCCASLTSLQGDQHDDCRIFITSDALCFARFLYSSLGFARRNLSRTSLRKQLLMDPNFARVIPAFCANGRSRFCGHGRIRSVPEQFSILRTLQCVTEYRKLLLGSQSCA